VEATWNGYTNKIQQVERDGWKACQRYPHEDEALAFDQREDKSILADPRGEDRIADRAFGKAFQ